MRRDDGSGRPLRLLWVIDSLAMGGAERLAVSFARGAAAEGIDLCVCCLKRLGGNPLEEALRATGVRCEVLGARHLRDLRAFARLRALVREREIEIVHSHLLYAITWGALAARLEHVPSVATLHVPPAVGPAWSRERLRERLMCASLKGTRATVVAVSAALRERYLRRQLLDASRSIVVPNGIDAAGSPAASAHAAADLRRRLGLPPDARVILATAVLREPRKGLHVLLEAMPPVLARWPMAHVVVIGDGPLLPGLQAQAERLGIAGSVHWAGARHDVASLLAGAEIFVHPALDDPFPTAVLEAMAAALPVVATTVDGIPEMIASGRTGRLVPPAQAPALAEALADLLGDATARVALGSAARRTVLERFSTEVWVRRLRQVYDHTLVAGHVPARPDQPPERVAS